MLLPVFNLMMSLSSEVQHLSANQISSTYLHPRLRYNYFRFEKQTSAILEFYFRFRFRPYHRTRHVVLHQSARFYLNRTAHGRKMTCRFSRWRRLDFRGPIMDSLKSSCTISYRSSIETIVLNCLLLEKIAFLHFGDRQLD